jgi:glycosyltransferase involved in cell wall biosynthesis
VVDTRAFGGAEVYVARLIRLLPPRYSCVVLATAPVPARLAEAAREGGTELREIPSVRTKRDVGRIMELARALRGADLDLVHLNVVSTGNNRHALLIALLLRLPVVSTFHLGAPVGGWQRTFWRIWYRRTKKVIAVSSEIGRHVTEDLGLPLDAVQVIPNGVEVWEPVSPKERETVRIGGAGRLTRQKGFDLLVASVGRLHAEGITLDAAVAGEGPELARLSEMADGLPVRFVGFVDDMRGFLRGLDVFCLPSRWEGLPFALLEAMMSGLACVGSGVGDVTAALGPAGLIVEPDDLDALVNALRRLVLSAPLRRELGTAAHARACDLYRVEAMVEAVARIYDEALAVR